MMKHIIGSDTTDKMGVIISGISHWIQILAQITCYSLGSNYPETVVRVYVTQMVQKIKHKIGRGTANKKGVIIFRAFTAERDWHISHVIPWGQITLKQWSYPLLN